MNAACNVKQRLTLLPRTPNSVSCCQGAQGKDMSQAHLANHPSGDHDVFCLLHGLGGHRVDAADHSFTDRTGLLLCLLSHCRGFGLDSALSVSTAAYPSWGEQSLPRARMSDFWLSPCYSLCLGQQQCEGWGGVGWDRGAPEPALVYL